MSKYSDMARSAQPTQTERGDSRQVVNSAGGYVYQTDDATRLRRFLILGTEGGTFYASERDLTKVNLDFMKEFAAKDPKAFYNVLADVDADNIAPRHSTILLALAVLFAQAGQPSKDKRIEREGVEVYDAIKAHFPQFVRTGTHLFEFVDNALLFRKWGRGLRTVIGDWYKDKDPEALAYQITKYRQRGGWTHRDLLRKAHPKPVDTGVKAVVDYAVHGRNDVPVGFQIIDQFEDVKAGTLTPVDASALTWEMLPTDSLKDPNVWIALIRGGRLPYTAMLRNLGRMTSIGVFNVKDGGQIMRTVTQKITDPDQIVRARLHPFNVLTALKTYQSGGGFRGNLIWTAKRQIIDALDAAFYLAFSTVAPSDKSTLLALDVSASMNGALMNSNISARAASTAMAMVSLAAAPDTTDMVAFTSNGGAWRDSSLIALDFSPRERLDDIIRRTNAIPFGGTDCALPILHALEQKKFYDTFVVYTDNETWAGRVQVPDALRMYRQAINPQARMVVVGMTATEFTIADPQDPLSLDVVGFNPSAPRVIAEFSDGRF